MGWQCVCLDVASPALPVSSRTHGTAHQVTPSIMYADVCSCSMFVDPILWSVYLSISRHMHIRIELSDLYVAI